MKYSPVLGLDVILKISYRSKDEVMKVNLLMCETELSICESICLSVTLKLDRPTRMVKDSQGETGREVERGKSAY